jgi:hypothetical protein
MRPLPPSPPNIPSDPRRRPLPPSPLNSNNSNFENVVTPQTSPYNEDTHNAGISFGFTPMFSKATAFSKTVKNKLNALKKKRNNSSNKAKGTASSSTPPTYYELDGSIVHLKLNEYFSELNGKYLVLSISNSSSSSTSYPKEVYSSPEAANAARLSKIAANANVAAKAKAAANVNVAAKAKTAANAKAAANTKAAAKAAANAKAAIERTVNEARQALVIRKEDPVKNPKFLNTLRSKVQEIVSKHDLCNMTEATCRSLVDHILEQVIDEIKPITVVGIVFEVGPLFRTHCKVYYDQLKSAFAATVHEVFVSGEIRRICESQSGENRNVLLSKMIIDFILGIREGGTMNTFIGGRSNVFINQVGTYWRQDVQKHIRDFETDFLNVRRIWQSYFPRRGGYRHVRSRRRRTNRRNTRRRRI